jgi:uncharacterized protein (TIGR02145 family)
MKQTFTFLTILLIFTSQVFGQVKTIDKEWKKLIINIYGTWSYDETKSRSTASSACHEIIASNLDKVTGKYGRQSYAPIILTKGGDNKIGILLFEYNSIIGLIFNVERAVSCIDDTDKVYILFRDGTRLMLENDKEFNCDGLFELYFGSIYYGKKKILETLKTKEIETLRIVTNNGYVEQDLTSENSKEFIKSVNCLISNNVSNGVKPNSVEPIKPDVKLTSYLVKDIDGYQYPISQIGIKFWMADNLRVTRFNNSDEITEIINDKKWSETNKSAWSIYDNSLKYGQLLGNLYNGNAINDERNICPVGWHVPTDSDWEDLIKTIGGTRKAGIKLRATKGWLPSINGTNESGLKCIPGGSRNDRGEFYGAGKFGVWWSSTNDPSGLKLYARTLTNDKQDVVSYAANPKIGAYVRCVRD